MRSALVLAALAACAPVGPLVLDVQDTRRGAAVDLLGDACDLLGVECVVGGDDAPVSLVIVESCSVSSCGKCWGGCSCGAVKFAEDDAATIAHELGHALCLEHREGPGLMSVDGYSLVDVDRGVEPLSASERDEIEHGLRKLARCR